MCKYIYTQHSCSCKNFRRRPQYCAAVLASSSSSPPRRPWMPLLSISDPSYQDSDFDFNYSGKIVHLQAESLFKPALECQEVEKVQEGGDEWFCELHADPDIMATALGEKWRLEMRKEEERRKEEEEKEKKGKLRNAGKYFKAILEAPGIVGWR